MEGRVAITSPGELWLIIIATCSGNKETACTSAEQGTDLLGQLTPLSHLQNHVFYSLGLVWLH